MKITDYTDGFRLLGFATGFYTNKCTDCGKEFTGDKRACMCFSCAINEANKLEEQARYLQAQVYALHKHIKLQQVYTADDYLTKLEDKLKNL